MKRIFSDFAYGPGPRDGCWWDETIEAPDWPIVRGDQRADVTIVGGGFTGISAALHLAEAGMSVIVLESETPGWGASGRNGGFCCLGGAKIETPALVRAYGKEGAQQYRNAEKAAVALVANLLGRFDIAADTHSKGETCLAHRPKDMENLRASADQIITDYGVEPKLIEARDLKEHGFGGAFHGAMTIPIGFGLNPRKYLFGLARAAIQAGASLFQQSPAVEITQGGAGYVVKTPLGEIRSQSVIIATNGYSSEDLPGWLAGRYMPTQSNVMVTRPLTQAELEAQGWLTDQMSYDTRNLLHYFRLMPDRRFLFGMRGGLNSSAGSEHAARVRNRRDFDQMFPAWAHVESHHSWSGMVCLSRNRVPFIGPVPDHPGLFAGLAYHGNGVAMGSWTGAQLAGLVTRQLKPDDLPAPLQNPMPRFPFGRARRALMPPVYAGLMISDLV